jgi:hypothetical protein
MLEDGQGRRIVSGQLLRSHEWDGHAAAPAHFGNLFVVGREDHLGKAFRR